MAQSENPAGAQARQAPPVHPPPPRGIPPAVEPRKYTIGDLENAFREGLGQWNWKQILSPLAGIILGALGIEGFQAAIDPPGSSLPAAPQLSETEIEQRVQLAADERIGAAEAKALEKGSERGYLLALKLAHADGLVEPVPESLFQPGEMPSWRFKSRAQIAGEVAAEAAKAEAIPRETPDLREPEGLPAKPRR